MLKTRALGSLQEGGSFSLADTVINQCHKPLPDQQQPGALIGTVGLAQSTMSAGNQYSRERTLANRWHVKIRRHVMPGTTLIHHLLDAITLALDLAGNTGSQRCLFRQITQ